MFWWSNIGSEVAYAHIQPTNFHCEEGRVEGQKVRGIRWTDHLNKVASNHVLGIDLSATTSSSSPATAPLPPRDPTLPAIPLPTRIDRGIRVERLRAKYTRYPECLSTEENEWVWKQVGITTCKRGLGMNEHYPTGTQGCNRAATIPGPYCDIHTCVAVNGDGDRCTSYVPDPYQSRYCSSGYHQENGRAIIVFEQIANRQAQLDQEQADREADFEERTRTTSSSPPPHTPELRQDSLTSSSIGEVRTPLPPHNAEIEHPFPFTFSPTPADVDSDDTTIGLGLTFNGGAELRRFDNSFRFPNPVGTLVQYGFQVDSDSVLSDDAKKPKREGNFYAKLMRERYGNGYVRRQAHNRGSPDTD